ncbi:MAG: ABC transporter ATP-binding protein [Clostridia bacterium]|nr:ABC transporter ATP-binding protein [Clostridia bacterium]
MRKLARYIKGYGIYVVIAPICMILEVLLELRMPMMMARIVDEGIPNMDLPFILRIGGIMLLLSLGGMLCGILNMVASSTAAQGFGWNVRQALFRRITAFAYSDIDRFSTASLVTRLTNDVTQMQNTFMMTLRLMIRAPFMMVFALILAIGIHARLALILLVAIPILSAGILFIMTRAEKLFAAMQRKVDALNGTVQENLIAIRVVKAFVREAHEKSKFRKSNDELTQAGIKAATLVITIMPLMTLVMNMATICVLWFGGHLVGSGELTTGRLISFIQYITQILSSLMMVSMVFLMAARARASGNRIVEVLETKPAIRDEEGAVLAANGDAPAEGAGGGIREGRIEFRDVCFRYLASGSGEDVLSHVSFTAEPGEVIAIVGGTGTGKTSLVHLVPRLYDVTGGQVLIDGTDVREYGLRSLRDSIGIVLQNNVLFSGTIRDNLQWGDAGASDEEIAAAAETAQAHEFITGFPDGYDTVLGQGGINLSGGQKQRLCIARALLRRPRILILDDSTSAVDSDTERGIRQAFRERLQDTTVLLIAQRISSVSWADRILVLDNGRLVGNGTHAELLASCQVYREICSTQIEGGVA